MKPGAALSSLPAQEGFMLPAQEGFGYATRNALLNADKRLHSMIPDIQWAHSRADAPLDNLALAAAPAAEVSAALFLPPALPDALALVGFACFALATCKTNGQHQQLRGASS